MNKKILAVLVGGLSLFATAGQHVGDVKIKRVRVFDGFALIQTDKDIAAPTCAVNKRHIIVPLPDTRKGDRYLSVILAAQAQKKIFNPYCYDSCDDRTWMGPLTKCEEVSIE